jgi:phage terminase large subunit-like protein
MQELSQNIIPSADQIAADISMLNRDQKEQYLKLLKEKATRIKQNRIIQYYPEAGPLSRHNYTKHMAFFAAGATFPERCIMAANRIGKSEGIGAYEMTLHLTGRYPDWWVGKRFTQPITAWACGTTSTTARDIVQFKLVGTPEEHGTGLIPEKYIIKTTPRAGGVPNAIDTILVQHISGGFSRCKIKSYAEGRKSFEGTEQDIIWLDEECPLDIYTECLTRTMTTNGLIMLTFTPLAGLTETVLQFMPEGKIQEHQEGSRFLIQATWDDAPHLTSEQKEKLFAALPPHQREARSKGVPQLGSGAIFPNS